MLRRIRQKRFVYYPNGLYVPCDHHTPVILHSTQCWTTETVCTQLQDLIMLNSSSVSHAAIGMAHNKVIHKLFQGKAICCHICIYIYYVHILCTLLLSSEPHTVRLLVRSGILNCQDRHRISFQQLFVTVSARAGVLNMLLGPSKRMGTKAWHKGGILEW